MAFDYAFVRRDDEEDMRDRDSKALRGWVLERKGADMDENVDRAVVGVRELGYRGRVLIRTDGEPALVALSNAIMKALPEGATPIKTPVAESSSNGGVEGGVRIFKVLLCVHLAALERRIGAKFPSNHHVPRRRRAAPRMRTTSWRHGRRWRSTTRSPGPCCRRS